MAQANGGAILHINQKRGFDVLALYPQLEKATSAPEWLVQSAKAANKVISSNTIAVEPLDEPNQLYNQPAKRHVLMLPFKTVDMSQTVAAFLIETTDNAVLEKSRQRLELSTKLLSNSEMMLSQQTQGGDLKRLRQAMEILSALNQQDKFTSASMVFCNEVASQWLCERVSIGFLEGRYVQLKAMSHTEDFSRKMKVVQDIESAMEECLDQDIEVLSPASDNATYINRAADELSKRHSPLTVLSLPLRRNGEVIAVLTLERPADKAFSVDEIEIIRLTCELCTSGLKNLYEYNRWIGATIAIKTRNFFAGFLGPKHTLAKFLTILSFMAILFLVFGKGQFRPQASFVLEATQQQVIPAPFEGYIKGVEVEVGDNVEGNDSILATLDTAELRLQLAAAKAEKAGYLKQVSAAMRDNETAQAQIAQANADKSQAQIDLLNYRIGQANLISPISGIVVKGDLKRQIGAPVKTGDVLFEVCPLESLRAQLMVPEDLIFDIEVGQEGKLATASYPGQPIKFVVERINPMAEVVNQRNVFKVRVHLLETYPWMRPGMEGVAKVSVGKRRYIWIWTRKITNWIRMKLWL
ncbi:MAG: HlyD family efflux transporter periplasmic adaptor subunit [Planctomycetota bacterium]